MTLLLISALALAAPDVERAGQLYEKARYEKALKALGDSCAGAADGVACERLRGFVLAALGQEPEAKAAFERMLVLNPDAMIGDDIAPKLQTLFSNAKRDVNALLLLELDAVDTQAEAGTWVLRVTLPPEVEIKSLTARVALGSDNRFSEVPLTKQGDAWLGTLKVADEGGEKLRYSLLATLTTGVAVPSGSDAAPLTRAIRGLKSGGPVKSTSPFDSPGMGLEPAPAQGLPDWALWAIVGGAVVVVAAGVTAAILMTRDSGPGNVQVNVEFVDTP